MSLIIMQAVMQSNNGFKIYERGLQYQSILGYSGGNAEANFRGDSLQCIFTSGAPIAFFYLANPINTNAFSRVFIDWQYNVAAGDNGPWIGISASGGNEPWNYQNIYFGRDEWGYSRRLDSFDLPSQGNRYLSFGLKHEFALSSAELNIFRIYLK
ncbi:hypothetical protein SAMN04488134_101764 [Amphibacillus marinus]|uniref:Uncharacterized protein n=1 Tax=Amphibacillus marinus TaxID=872970 RepID=A0A1H8IYY4_9BACI|nr:hypothetical protein [Amphibacillus marinus]SEN73256.1 hypothetical protein SAMN04488134_101764 [Amphibacillus marinus]